MKQFRIAFRRAAVGMHAGTKCFLHIALPAMIALFGYFLIQYQFFEIHHVANLSHLRSIMQLLMHCLTIIFGGAFLLEIAFRIDRKR